MSDAKEDALKKLAQIQEQAELTLAELPHRLAKDRLRLIIGLARILKSRIEDWGALPLPAPDMKLSGSSEDTGQ